MVPRNRNGKFRSAATRTTTTAATTPNHTNHSTAASQRIPRTVTSSPAHSHAMVTDLLTRPVTHPVTDFLTRPGNGPRANAVLVWQGGGLRPASIRHLPVVLRPTITTTTTTTTTCSSSSSSR